MYTFVFFRIQNVDPHLHIYKSLLSNSSTGLWCFDLVLFCVLNIVGNDFEFIRYDFFTLVYFCVQNFARLRFKKSAKY